MEKYEVVGDKKKHLDIAKVVAVIEAAIIVALIVALVACGKNKSSNGSQSASKSTDKMPKSTSSAQVYGVCAEDISKFNSIYTNGVIGTGDFKNRMKNVASDAMGRDGASDDPTCLFIDFKYQITAFNVDGAQKDYDKLKSLATRGQYPSNDLITISSMKDMQTDIDSINQSLKTDDDASQQGVG